MTDWRAYYDSIELTDQETKDAILEGKIKKYFKEKNKGYWQAQENGGTRKELSESLRPRSW